MDTYSTRVVCILRARVNTSNIHTARSTYYAYTMYIHDVSILATIVCIPLTSQNPFRDYTLGATLASSSSRQDFSFLLL